MSNTKLSYTDVNPEHEQPDESSAEPHTVFTLSNVTKQFGPEVAVNSLSLSVHEGELLTLLGPSGCGKTTTLRLLAGLTRPDAGSVSLNGDVIADSTDTFKSPEERDVGLVFQDFALFPHLTVAENIGFGLTDHTDDARQERIDELLDLVDLTSHRDRKPDQLSGGQKQRVALARSLAPEPAVLLLDEPFSNLDVALRTEMRQEVRSILKTVGATAISVTHDQEEALSISDRVAVMSDGNIEQVGRPEQVFQHPESRFVADFLGQAGFLTARYATDQVATAIGAFDPRIVNGLTPEYEGSEIDLLVRPDDLRAMPEDEADANGRVVARKYTGPSFVYRVELDSGEYVHCEHNHVTDFEYGQPVVVDLVADHTLAWYPA